MTTPGHVLSTQPQPIVEMLGFGGGPNRSKAGYVDIIAERWFGRGKRKKFGALFELQPDTVAKLKEVLLPKK